MNDLASLLLDGLQRAEGTGRLQARLLLELALGGREQVFAGVGLAFGDRPGARVLAAEQRATGVCQQDFQHLATDSIHQQAGTNPRHADLLQICWQPDSINSTFYGATNRRPSAVPSSTRFAAR